MRVCEVILNKKFKCSFSNCCLGCKTFSEIELLKNINVENPIWHRKWIF